MFFIGCTKENSLTLNSSFDPAATGETATEEVINIDLGGNTGGGNTGGGTSRITGAEGLIADFNGTEENFLTCRFTQNGGNTTISATKFDNSQSLTMVVTGTIVAGNSYTFNTDGSITYQSDVQNPSANTVYTSQGGSVTFSSVSSNELIGTFTFSGDNTAQSNPIVVSNGELKAIK
ncbi:MAG: hypothetical protein CMO34_06275 [Verrucomicrobia bacterium]|nr:hypothetical protein [Verrucomicrobiota bacterium]|tara:strand:- start:491 stop:1021 length:531 start_codon:yes stop_codon:yes gene_type:complete